MILLDSNFEIALKEFIVNRMDLFPPNIYNDAKIVAPFKARHLVINEVKAHVNLSKTLLGKVSHYYNLRNKLVHERATVGITDTRTVSRCHSATPIPHTNSIGLSSPRETIRW